MPNTTRDSFYEKPLFRLVSGGFPEFRTPAGVFSVENFGRELSMSNEGVYKWFRADRLTADGLRKIISLAQRLPPPENCTRPTQEALLPFLLR